MACYVQRDCKIRIGNAHVFGDVTLHVQRPWPFTRKERASWQGENPRLGRVDGRILGDASPKSLELLIRAWRDGEKHATTVAVDGRSHRGASYITNVRVTPTKKPRLEVDIRGTGRWS